LYIAYVTLVVLLFITLQHLFELAAINFVADITTTRRVLAHALRDSWRVTNILARC